MDTSPSSVSVIIPTKDRPVDLDQTVRSVLRQTRPAAQLVIIDQGKGGESGRLVEEALNDANATGLRVPHISYVLAPNLTGLTQARNQSMRLANADIWLFLDDDVILDIDFIEQLLLAYSKNPEATGISGVVINYPCPRWTARIWPAIFLLGPLKDDRQGVYWRASKIRYARPVRVTRLGGGLMSFRADAVRGMEFDENLQGVSDGEDVDFCARLGQKSLLLIAPAARLIHNQSPAGRDQTHWLRRHSRSIIYLYTKNWRRGLKNRLCFTWLVVGYLLAGTFGSLRRFSLEPWRALLSGRRDGLAAASRGPLASRFSPGTPPDVWI